VNLTTSISDECVPSATYRRQDQRERRSLPEFGRSQNAFLGDAMHFTTEPIGFLLAVLIVLLTPGPTNSLLVIAAATLTWRKAFLLIPAEIAGYFISIATLLILLRLGSHLAPIGMLLRVACACYLTYVSFFLWRTNPSTSSQKSPDFRKVFVVTVLNPKGLVFAAAIFPNSPDSTFQSIWPYFAAFGIVCVLVASAWIIFGTALRKGSASYLSIESLQRVTAAVLACFAILLLGSTFANLSIAAN
jgi:threonine/homoserine/homoserine lactone efflux protein